MSRHEQYLWDPSGPPDPEVEALERALSPLRHRGEPPAVGAPSAPAGGAARLRRGRSWGLWWAAAAAVLVAAWAGSRWLESGPEVRLSVAASGELLSVGERRQVAGEAEILTMETPRLDDHGDPTGEFEWTGELTLAPGSDLVIESLSSEQTDLRLDRGQLEAFVSADAVPGFFQVGTPAAKCIDLGCQYTLTVDDAGNAHVEVLMGRVAFRNADGREVLVLTGATCRASRDRGAGTPRFSESPAGLLGALDAFDAASDEAARRRAALSVVREAAGADERHDQLPLWHLLGDPDEEVARLALRHLETRFGTPPGLTAGELPDAMGRELWKAHLDLEW